MVGKSFKIDIVKNRCWQPFVYWGMSTKPFNSQILIVQGVFCDWCPPKKLKYGKPRLGESELRNVTNMTNIFV